MPRKNELLGRFVNDDGETVWVSASGRSYRISHGGREHLCHPSVRALHDVPREALLVFGVKAEVFLPTGT